MKKYETYKPSGIEWIDEIPSHWENVSIKWISKIFAGGTPSKDKEEYWYNGSIPWLNSGTVNQGLITEPSEFITELGFEKSSAKWIPKGALVIALAGQGKTKGIVAQLGFDATCNQSMAAIIPQREVQSRYLLYWLQSNYQNIRNLGGGDLRDGLNLDMIGSIKSIIPSEQEQTAIAHYLDRKTTEIDELIADKKHLLTLYEEEKTALINQAVTKGVDPNAKMKDSGIEWLGKIPEHWEVKRLKYVASINDEVLTEKTDEDFEIEYVEISGVKSGIGIVETSNYRFKDAPSRARRIVRDGDLLVSTVRTYLKSIAKVDNPANNLIASTGFAVVRPRNIDSDYSGYLFYTEPLIGEIISRSVGVSYPAINSSDIGDISIPIPPLDEQQSIVHHIETECARIDTKVGKTEKLISLLEEYRTALISEVVTGKVKVV